MNNYHLTLPGNLSAAFSCTIDFLDNADNALYLHAHIPGATLKKEEKKEAPQHLRLRHVPSENYALHGDYPNIELHAPNTPHLKRDSIHILYGMCRTAFLENGLYPVHAACVEKDRQGILIVGHSGAGKTTLAEELVAKHDFKLFSGNKTIVKLNESEMIASAGTKTITRIDRSLKRTYRAPLPEEVSNETDLNISDIFMVQVNDGISIHQKPHTRNALPLALPFFLDVIHQHTLIHNGESIYCGGTPNYATQALAHNLGHLAKKKVRIHRLSGSFQFMKDSIATTMSP